jgi:DNA-binding phage protein
VTAFLHANLPRLHEINHHGRLETEMKLSPTDIAAIEGLMAQLAEVKTLAEIAAFRGLSKHGTQQLSTWCAVMGKIGVKMPERPKMGPVLIARSEMAAFCEWKAMQEAAKAAQQ